ncbi:Ankyrin repeat domain-containing protein [Mycena venus]|uniref:Ankyrin repeat domain-containing protein n=1 Tax=Mycena venus TaxID=2733690 RepID=A0A8H6YV65_9AGAR|nr:Ankyrin repeat domain-containing protein [Mycena venus]
MALGLSNSNELTLKSVQRSSTGFPPSISFFDTRIYLVCARKVLVGGYSQILSSNNGSLVLEGHFGAVEFREQGKPCLPRSKVVDHLTAGSESKDVGVACIYLNHKEADTQTPDRLLAGLWRQLVLGQDIGPLATKLYEQHHEKGTTPSLDDVCEVLISSLVNYPKVYIIVDAIDEYPEVQRRILLRHLVAMGPHSNLMITSRPNITPDASLPHLETLDICARAEDLLRYVDGQIDSSPRLSKYVQSQPALREDIHSKISSHTVDGMFLLAKLHIESLATKNTIKAIRAALNSLPHTLRDSYNVAMQRIEAQSEEDRKTARLAIIWVANAKRPLTVEEIQAALAVEPGARQLDKENVMDIEIILATCAGLVIIDEQRSIVRLVHYTTQEYLDSIQKVQFPDAQTEIARTLLTLLAFDGYPDPSWRSWKLPPLISYSQYCLVHAAGKSEAPLRKMIVEFLSHALQWKQRLSGPYLSAWNTPPWNFFWPSQPSALWIAAAANMLGTAKFLLEEGPMNKHPDGSGISVASYYGYFEMVQLLVENGADVNTPSNQHGPPLTAASGTGRDRIVEFLLKNGADINACGGRYDSALHAALANKQEKMVRLLIEHGADVNLATGEHGGVLMMALWYGMENIVPMLLERGADVNARGGKYGYVLRMAFAQKQEKTAQLLIQNGANVNQQVQIDIDESFVLDSIFPAVATRDSAYVGEGTLLTSAAYHGRQNEVRLLLENGADVNALGGRYGFALQAAVFNGHENIARLLIKKGANVNFMDNIYGTPLATASSQGNKRLVQLLIDNGANLDVKGPYGTAVEEALFHGHNDIAKLLIQHRAIVTRDVSGLELGEREGTDKEEEPTNDSDGSSVDEEESTDTEYFTDEGEFTEGL